MLNLKRKEKIIRIVKEELVNIGIDAQLIDDVCLNEKVNYIINEDSKILDSYDLDINIDDYCMFIFLEKTTYEDVQKLIEEKFNISLKQENITYKNANIFFVFRKLEDELMFSNEINKSKFKNYIKSISKNQSNGLIEFKAKNIDYNFLTCGECSESKFEIQIKSRIQSLEFDKKIPITDKNKLKVTGYVFTAKLFDIVKIYNKLGSDLFNYNVRCSIKDELEVDSKIKLTLRDEPKDFWYLNNGITIVINNSRFELKKDKLLEINYEKESVLSIINGAQTVSASAEFYYDKNLPSDIKERSKEAEVLLRIIHLGSTEDIIDDEEQKRQYLNMSNLEINKISIALNRQKPIKPEDIAYTMPLIYGINKLRDNNFEDKLYFSLVRRGEEFKNGYDLVTFVKMIKAYIDQKPGQALNDAAKKILNIEINNGEPEFTDKVFEKLEFENNEITETNFKKYFAPVNFAIDLGNRFSDIKKELIKELEQNEDEQGLSEALRDKKTLEIKRKTALYNYGKYYFVSYVVYVLNDKKTNDFSNFNVSIKDNENLKLLIKKYVELFNEIIEENKQYLVLDLSKFKNEELYKILTDCDKKEFVDKINLFNKELRTYFIGN
ncbi:AIPR family protein [Clostridium beijerinckii]|uniref:AIPR family protein n=1 Tax=Clostridium beijerinckii TaxID=1520 RepID=UPI001494C357|nr:AIPR family protein [Clostridium beijerinckii]NOW04430.1 uncharacterized protein YlaI [Clostridium beijerinckii]NYC02428.1 uncharacterized protein YlaI [Clostridium beijerinckii]